MDRVLWTRKPGFNAKFKRMENEKHCGNCANSGKIGCISAIIFSETDITVTVQSRCSGVKTTYPKFFKSKGVWTEMIKPDLTNHRNYKKFGTIKKRRRGNGGAERKA